MIDLLFHSCRDERATITPRTSRGTAWLSDNYFRSMWDNPPIRLDTPVTLSLDGAIELDAMARTAGLHTDGL